MACYGRIGYVSDVQEVQLVQRMDGLTSSAGDVLIRPEYKIQKGACSGIWELGFTSSHSDSPLKTPVPGAYPPVLMVRTFLSDATTDLQSCLLLDSKLTGFDCHSTEANAVTTLQFQRPNQTGPDATVIRLDFKAE